MSGPEKTTARVRRAQAQAAMSDAVDDALHATRTKQVTVQRALGFSTPTKIQQWIDNEHKALPTLADLACMPRELAWALLRTAANVHGLVVAEAPSSTGGDLRGHLVRIANCQRESSEATAAHAQAIADGDLTRAEALRVRAEHRQAMEAHAAAMASLDLVLERKSR